jgi:hypothetical protein
VSLLAPTLQAFFTDRLVAQKRASAHDRRLPRHDPVAARVRRRADRQSAERPGHRRSAGAADRRVPGSPRARGGNTIRTRNARLAAIRSLFRYAALRHPEHAATPACPGDPDQASRSSLVTFLTDPELQALLDAPDRSTWIAATRSRDVPAGRPDRAARQRVARPEPRRPAPRHRRARQLRRQGPQAVARTAETFAELQREIGSQVGPVPPKPDL